jgi:hypothetical protein
VLTTIEIKNDLNLQDFAEAERITPAHGHRFYWFMFVATRANLVFLVLASLLLIGLAADTTRGLRSPNDAWGFALACVLVALFLAGKFRQVWTDRYGKASARMASYPYRAVDTISVVSSGIGMLSGISDAATTSLAWDEFIGFHEGPTIFLIIEKESHQELIVPKRSLSESDQNALRKLLQANVGSW